MCTTEQREHVKINCILSGRDGPGEKYHYTNLKERERREKRRQKETKGKKWEKREKKRKKKKQYVFFYMYNIYFKTRKA